MATFDEKRAADLKALALEATPGGWRHTRRIEGYDYVETQVIDGPGATLCTDDLEGDRADAAFIAAADPKTVLALLEALETANAQVKAIITACSQVSGLAQTDATATLTTGQILGIIYAKV